MNVVAREYELEIGECAFAPNLVEHIPGVTNIVADLVSRRTDPHYASTWQVPQLLANDKEVTPPPRVRGWWRSLGTTGDAQASSGGCASSDVTFSRQT